MTPRTPLVACSLLALIAASPAVAQDAPPNTAAGAQPAAQDPQQQTGETIIVTAEQGMAVWREKLFVVMARNAVRATAFFRLPPERVVELGVQVEM